MIRVPAQFNGPFITRHFFPKYLRLRNLSAINQGRCYDWAYYAYRMFPHVNLWTTDYHAWVQVYDNNFGYRFYDSETPKGVKSFMDLGCNRRHAPAPWESQAPTRMGVEDFKKFWDKHGGGFKRHWDSMLEEELKTVLGKRYREQAPIFAKPVPALVVP